MMNKISYLLIICCLLILGSRMTTYAQEMNAQVIIQTPKLQVADPKLFKTLETELRNFVNESRWTNENFQVEERVECSFLISIIEEVSQNTFIANITVQSNRPVYNSNYNSMVLNHQDKNIKFSYFEYEPLEFNENGFESELTSVIGYYVYLILGLDFDTFSSMGGNPYYQKAQQVVSYAQSSSSEKGWTPLDYNRVNRYWIVENMLNSKFAPMRQAAYSYHREGLDMMYNDTKSARTKVLNAMVTVQNMQKAQSNSAVVPLFVNAKNQEIISIFSDKEVAFPDKTKAYNAMIAIDPASIQKYQKINTNPNNLPGGITLGRGGRK